MSITQPIRTVELAPVVPRRARRHPRVLLLSMMIGPLVLGAGWGVGHLADPGDQPAPQPPTFATGPSRTTSATPSSAPLPDDEPAPSARPVADRPAGPVSRSAAPPIAAPVSFRNCAAARVAGVAPIQREEPGYAAHLDRDSDGVACEDDAAAAADPPAPPADPVDEKQSDRVDEEKSDPVDEKQSDPVETPSTAADEGPSDGDEPDIPTTQVRAEPLPPGCDGSCDP